MVIPHYMGITEEKISAQNKQQDPKPKGMKKMDSFSSSSSCQDIPLLLPQEPDRLVQPNGNLEPNGNVEPNGNIDHPSKASRSQPLPFRKTKVEHSVQDLQMKAFVDDLGFPHPPRGRPQLEVIGNVHPTTENSDEWWETQDRGDQVVSADEAGQVGPRTLCHCQVRALLLS